MMNREDVLSKMRAGGTSVRASSVRKMSAQLAKKSGYDKWTVRFLAKIACLLNSLSEGESTETRAREAILWSITNSEEVCGRLAWTKQNLVMAQAILAHAGGLLTNGQMKQKQISAFTQDLLPAQRAEILELGQILAFVERVAECTTSWRRRAVKPTLRSVGKAEIIVDEETTEVPSFENLKQERELYELLPQGFRRQLERVSKLAKAA